MIYNEPSEQGGVINNPPCMFQAKNWIMTWNNYPTDVFDQIRSVLVPLCEKYVFGKEIGDEGTPHIQGAFILKKKIRQGTIYNLFNAKFFLEKMKGKWESQSYCKKDGEFITSDETKWTQKLKKIFFWEMYIIKILETEPNDRDIFWFWEDRGGVGKTTFQKFIYGHYDNVIALSGKASDMKNGICQMKVLPNIILINIPRSSLDYVSYAGIEEIKDMFFFSPKYESGMVCGKNPHVLIFANEPPRDGYMSEDKWKIINLESMNNLIKDIKRSTRAIEDA